MYILCDLLKIEYLSSTFIYMFTENNDDCKNYYYS